MDLWDHGTYRGATKEVSEMTDQTLSAERLKTIRKARKIGRPKLAKMAGLTERQLTKLETAKAPVLDVVVLDRLSDALQVPAPTLTGDLALIEDDLQPASEKKCTSGCCG